MIRLGKFTDAIQAGDERRSSLRKENATLYSEFISQNPGASLEERTKFANNLIQQTGVGSRGLPTKSTMKGAVDKYQKEEARKAAAAAKTANLPLLHTLRTLRALATMHLKLVAALTSPMRSKGGLVGNSRRLRQDKSWSWKANFVTWRKTAKTR